jgi:hypothetical protein
MTNQPQSGFAEDEPQRHRGTEKKAEKIAERVLRKPGNQEKKLTPSFFLVSSLA